jgi:serine protease Do
MENDRYNSEENAPQDFEQNTPQGSTQYRPTYVKPEKKPKRAVTWTQMIVALLVVGLLSGSLGALIVGGSQNALQSPGSSTVLTTPAPDASGSESGLSAGTRANAPSSGINMSSASASVNYESTTQMLQNSMASVVLISIEQNVYGADGSTTPEPVGSGSGVIITSDGYIVTNNHVVNGASSLKVTLQDGTEYEASIVGADSLTDLAIVKIEATSLPAATLGNSSSVIVGDKVYAIGNPLGVFTSSVSAGIVSGLNRTIEVEGQSMTLMQTDASVNPGNSGGGLFNENGELIGIVNSKSLGVDVEGLGFAIPIDDAKNVIVDLIDLGYVSGRPFLGVSLQELNLVESSSSGNSNNYFPFFMPSNYVTRVQVTEVMDGSAAQAAGIMVNDIILAVNKEEINGSSELASALYEYKIGDVVTITVQRGNESVDLKVTLAERPASN